MFGLEFLPRHCQPIGNLAGRPFSQYACQTVRTQNAWEAKPATPQCRRMRITLVFCALCIRMTDRACGANYGGRATSATKPAGEPAGSRAALAWRKDERPAQRLINTDLLGKRGLRAANQSLDSERVAAA
jgi:hypothetical protein